MTSVLIVDDQPLIRDAATRLLSKEPDIDVVGQAGDGDEALRFLASHGAPDLVLMDIRMPRMDGIQATKAICHDERYTGVHVLILTTFEEDEYVFSALRAGASGFIGKGSEAQDIVRAIRAVMAGEALLSPVATKALIERYIDDDRRAPTAATGFDSGYRLDMLTAREQEVLYLVGRGRSNQEIAEGLVISPLTAKTHVNRVMSKLQARDRAQLVIYAYESGLLNSDPRG